MGTRYREPWVNWLDFPVLMSAGYFNYEYQKNKRHEEVEQESPFLFALFHPTLWFSPLPSISPLWEALSFPFLSVTGSHILPCHQDVYASSAVLPPLLYHLSPPISSVLMSPGSRRHVPLVVRTASLVHVWTFCPLWRSITPCESVLWKMSYLSNLCFACLVRDWWVYKKIYD